ncbi:NADPH-dependent F420 reductase [Marisediminicola sp. LYQ85]|uniref:NADPH-dependent F420 reductase n=1 Tax=Marisediminicola sp. LYQ85 TaxID=3391062 RepID=UPI003982FF12
MTTIGFIGAGHIGSQVARTAIEAGHDVVMSNSRGPETLAALIADLGPRARAATATEAATEGDIVVVTVPLKAYRDVPVEPLAGKIVIDTNNYYRERDGDIAVLDAEEQTVSGLLQEHLPESRVVKAFNHITASNITSERSPAGTDDRRALAIAGDDDDARRAVADLLDSFGFDAVDVGQLSESWRVERDQPAYGARENARELRASILLAERNKNSR